MNFEVIYSCSQIEINKFRKSCSLLGGELVTLAALVALSACSETGKLHPDMRVM